MRRSTFAWVNATRGVGAVTFMLALAFLVGCTLVTPARFDRVAPKDVGAPAASGTPQMPLTGQYIATIYTQMTGPLRGQLLAEPTADGFRANTPPDVAWSLIGGLKGSLGPIFVPFIFPRGMLLTWTSTLPTADAPGLGSIGFGTRTSMRLTTRISEPGAPVELILRDGRVVGLMTLQRAGSGDTLPTNHTALVAALDKIVEQSLYDPAVANSQQMRSFVDDLREGSAKVHDDFEFMLVQALAIREYPRIPTPMVYPKPLETMELELNLAENPVRPYIIQADETTGITTVRFDAIVDEGEVDEAFWLATRTNPQGLIVDLRKGAGLDVGALRVLSWLTTSPVDAGTFVGRRDRDEILAGSHPPSKVVLTTPKDYEHLRDLLAQGLSANVRVTPVPEAFQGPVAVLLGSKASGTVEALASAIREHALAPTFGGSTKGQPFASSDFDLGQRWVARLCVAEFRPRIGESIVDSGVAPSNPTRGGGMDEAMQWLRSRLDEHAWDLPDWSESLAQ